MLAVIQNKEQLDLARETGRMWKGTLGPNQYMYTPIGSFIIERVLGDVTVFGYRTPCLNNNIQNLNIFKDMLDQYQVSIGEGQTSNVGKFWETVVKLASITK